MITVVYACNNTYIRQTMVSIGSVWKHNPEAKIYLIGDGISEANCKLLDDISSEHGKFIQRFDLDSVLPDMCLNQKDRHPHTIYAKLFLDQILEVDRALYLDSDVIVTGSLKELFERDMCREIIAGVLMPYSVKLKERMGVVRGKPYICDGVVLINLKLWRAEQKSQQCFKYILEQKGNPPMLSEGTLNFICQGSIGILNPKYNVMPSMLMYQLEELKKLFRADCYYSNAEDMISAIRQPRIIHYMNELYNRPWFEPCDHPYRDVYRNTEIEIFGENLTERIPLSRHTRRTVWLREHLPFGMFAALYHWKHKEI